MQFQNINKFRITSICLTILFLGLISASITHAETLKTAAGSGYDYNSISVKGSDTILPLAQAEAEEFMNENANVGKSISVTGGGTGVGIAALIDKQIDIATASRVITAAEIENAQKNGVNPVATTIAYDGITVIVNPSNPVSKLTFTQLRGIYNGSISNWRDVGGEDSKIVVITRDSSSGTYSYFKEEVLKGDAYRPDALTQATTGAIVSEVSMNPNAIGYIGFSYLDNNVKALSLDNGKGFVAPSVESISSGAYPLSMPLYMYTNGVATGLKKEYIDYIISDKGQQIVSKVGYIPITNSKPVAYFSASSTSGNAPLTVSFTDKSIGNPNSWKWSFGDGISSTAQNPVHKFSKAGKYTISLTVSNSAGSNTATKPDYIIVYPLKPPIAAFSASPQTGKAPFIVKFTDKSTGSPISWLWNFGDKTTSTIHNPTHKYTKAGKYTVSLTAKNAAGSNTKKISNYITVK